jgi:hypothetical protein
LDFWFRLERVGIWNEDPWRDWLWDLSLGFRESLENGEGLEMFIFGLIFLVIFWKLGVCFMGFKED